MICPSGRFIILMNKKSFQDKPWYPMAVAACIAVVLFVLFIYAIAWQQIIKKMPIVTAYANKAVMVIWGIVWGYVFFHEAITIQKIIGAVIIIAGVYLVVTGDDYTQEKEDSE